MILFHLHFAWGPAHEALAEALPISTPHQALALERDGLGAIRQRADLTQAMLQSLHDARVEEVKHASCTEIESAHITYLINQTSAQL